MKFALPLAFAMAFAATSAQATMTTSTHQKSMHHHRYHHHHSHGVHDKCHGMSSGTAHKSCGTRTGGPAGGLH